MFKIFNISYIEAKIEKLKNIIYEFFILFIKKNILIN